MATIRLSTFNELTKAILSMNVQKYFNINMSNLTITCKLNNKQIMFYGCDQIEKVKSITPKDGVLTDIFIEEATEVDYNSYKQLRKRLRGRSDVPKRVTLAFNPIMKTHWIYEEMFAKVWRDDETKYENEHMLIVKTTYKDNMFLEKDDIAELENETDPFYFNVYSCGNWGVLGSVIFKNWEVRDCSDIKKIADKRYYGIDWGFANDPTAWVELYYNSSKKELYILDEIYMTHLTNDELARMLIEDKQVGKSTIIADSSNPDRIYELCRKGLVCVPAVKGKGSIEYGIDWLLRQKIIIDVSCQNAKNEFQSYKWREDKFGNVLREPVDKDNHCLTGNTIVNTPNGDIAIKDLVGTTGKVYCYDESNGCRTISDYYDCRKTQTNADIYEIELEDGKTIKATKEHPVLTQRGWVRVGDLNSDDEILDISL